MSSQPSGSQGKENPVYPQASLLQTGNHWGLIGGGSAVASLVIFLLPAILFDKSGGGGGPTSIDPGPNLFAKVFFVLFLFVSAPQIPVLIFCAGAILGGNLGILIAFFQRKGWWKGENRNNHQWRRTGHTLTFVAIIAGLAFALTLGIYFELNKNLFLWPALIWIYFMVSLYLGFIISNKKDDFLCWSNFIALLLISYIIVNFSYIVSGFYLSSYNKDKNVMYHEH